MFKKNQNLPATHVAQGVVLSLHPDIDISSQVHGDKSAFVLASTVHANSSNYTLNSSVNDTRRLSARHLQSLGILQRSTSCNPRIDVWLKHINLCNNILLLYFIFIYIILISVLFYYLLYIWNARCSHRSSCNCSCIATVASKRCVRRFRTFSVSVSLIASPLSVQNLYDITCPTSYCPPRSHHFPILLYTLHYCDSCLYVFLCCNLCVILLILNHCLCRGHFVLTHFSTSCSPHLNLRTLECAARYGAVPAGSS